MKKFNLLKLSLFFFCVFGVGHSFALTRKVILTPAIHGDTNKSNLKLSYVWLNKFNKKHPTVILLHGGPGLDSSSLYNSYLGKELAKSDKFNVISFDQRGQGDSYYPIDEYAPKVFQSSQIVEDIEFLRSKIINQSKMVVLGHSYGATLAYMYATKYPQHVSKVVVASGLVDALGFTTQEPAKVRFFVEEMVKVFGQDAPVYYQAIKEESLFNMPEGNPYRSRLKYRRIHTLVSAYGSVNTFGVRRFLNNILKVYPSKELLPASQYQQVASIADVKADLNEYFTRNLDNIELSMNVVVTADDFIMCQNLMTESTIRETSEAGWDPLFAQKYQTYFCGERIKKYKLSDNYVNVSNMLNRISAPVMLVSGEEDFKPHISLVERDYLRLPGSNNILLKVPNCGHNTISQKCVVDAIKQFIGGENLDDLSSSCVNNSH